MNELALCSGVAMLSEGVGAGCEFLGLEHRVVCHVEREIPAAAQLVTLMEAGIINPAPIWDDLLSFDGKPWRGRVHCITAGFPCQPWSAAGKRAGTSDERWIWPDIARIVREIEPELCVFENVRGLISGGGLEFVLAGLAALGFDAEWCVVSAADVDASHQRERVFILAYRKGQRFGKTRGDSGRSTERLSFGSVSLENSESTRRGLRHTHDQRTADREKHPPCDTSEMLVNAGSEGLERRRSGCHSQGWQEQAGHAGLAGGGLFAPGPISDRWTGIIEHQPHLAPAIEPDVCVLVDGVAYVVDESRSDQLRQTGNGVVPLAAAVAFVVLARRAGILAGE